MVLIRVRNHLISTDKITRIQGRGDTHQIELDDGQIIRDVPSTTVDAIETASLPLIKAEPGYLLATLRDIDQKPTLEPIIAWAVNPLWYPTPVTLDATPLSRPYPQAIVKPDGTVLEQDRGTHENVDAWAAHARRQHKLNQAESGDEKERALAG